MDVQRRAELLESAGLVVLDAAWQGPAPAPMAAWNLVTRGDVTPAERVRIRDSNEHLSEVQRMWEQIAEASGLFGTQGDFLISVPGGGAAHTPWARVRSGGDLRLADKIADHPGEPEFVTMSVYDGIVCGVTTEEYDVWIVRAELPAVLGPPVR